MLYDNVPLFLINVAYDATRKYRIDIETALPKISFYFSITADRYHAFHCISITQQLPKIDMVVDRM